MAAGNFEERPELEANESYEISAEIKHLFALIGSITSAWSHLENSADITIWKLINVDARLGACVTSQIQSLAYRLFALISILKLIGADDATIKAANRFSNRVDILSRARNRVVHDPICAPSEGEPEALTITARREPTYGLFRGKMEEYVKINADIADLLNDYLQMETEIYASISKQIPTQGCSTP